MTKASLQQSNHNNENILRYMYANPLPTINRMKRLHVLIENIFAKVQAIPCSNKAKHKVADKAVRNDQFPNIFITSLLLAKIQRIWKLHAVMTFSEM